MEKSQYYDNSLSNSCNVRCQPLSKGSVSGYFPEGKGEREREREDVCKWQTKKGETMTELETNLQRVAPLGMVCDIVKTKKQQKGNLGSSLYVFLLLLLYHFTFGHLR